MLHKKVDAGFDSLSQDAAILSLCEIGLGSILHGLSLPFTGYLLSLNQIFFLSRSTLKTSNARAPLVISSIVAVLKSLSPAGKKLTPMLAISTQGFLFSLGTMVCGANSIGVWIGAILASVWSFFQPMLLYYFIFGKSLFEALGFFYKKVLEWFPFLPSTNHSIFLTVLFLVLLKALLASLLVVVAILLPESKYQKWQKKILSVAKTPAQKRLQEQESAKKFSLAENVQNAFHSVWNPLFIFSLCLMIVSLLFVEHSWAQFIWLALRPVAISFLLYLLLLLVPQEWWSTRFPLLALSLEKMKNIIAGL